MIVSKLRVAVEAAIRAGLASFVGAVGAINFLTTDIGGAKITLVAAGGAALAAAVAAFGRAFAPEIVDSQSVGVAGVSSPRSS